MTQKFFVCLIFMVDMNHKKMNNYQITTCDNLLLSGFPDGLHKGTRDPITLFTSYVSHLKKLYTSMSHSHTFQHWTHLPRCEYIQLAMIGKEDLQRGGPEEEMVRLAQKGKIETIMRFKENIKLSDLFMAPPKELVGVPRFSPIRVVLIEGAPGGGKSTLALHICHLWAQNTPFLDKFDIVILAYLRDEAIQNANTLADILPHSFGSSQILNSIKASGGHKVLFIFDGWDEFPFRLQQESLVSKIIREPRKVNLQRSTVIVTTRPVASGNLQYTADRRVEILGFTQDQVREYIGKALKGNITHIQKLVQHLEDHPVIEGYCYIPLHAAILVHIFLTLKKDLPTTHHELFCDLVLCCMVRELETHTPFKTVADVSSLDDLPDDLKSQLNVLCVLAYKGVMHDKVIFYKKYLQDFHLPANLPSLGLLQAVEGLTLTSKSLSYNFLHLSVQELLAAYHISQMNSCQQVDLFKQLLQGSRFLPVLHYYSGFTKLVNRVIQQFICDYSKHRAQFQDILPLLHCFFEAQQPSLSLLVDHRFRCIKVDSDIVNPVDYLVIGYFVKSLLCMPTGTDNGVSLTMNNINEHNFELLFCELSKYPATGGVPKCTAVDYGPCRLILSIHGMKITNKMMKILLSYLWQSRAIICEFSICDCYLMIDDGNDLLRLAETLQTIPNLSNLTLSNFTSSNTKLYRGDNGQAILEMFRLIMNNKSLTHLDLSRNGKLDSDGHRLIFQSLQLSTTLLNINLSNTGITSTEIETFKALEQMFQDNQSLTHLDLSKNAFSYTGVRCISQGLQSNTTLVHLDLSNTNLTATADTVQALTQMLKNNRSLKHLFLSNNNLHSETERCSIFHILKHNTSIVMLDLSNTGLTAEDTHVLETILEKDKTLAHLYLSNNWGVSDLGTQHIVQALQRNNTLVHLNLCQAGITNEGAKYIAQALTSKCSLQTLDISYNYIGDGQVVGDGFRHIERALESESCTLRKLTMASYLKYFLPQSRPDTVNKSRQRKGLPLIDIVYSYRK